MSILVANCPRCRAESITFDCSISSPLGRTGVAEWVLGFEAFCVCRRCKRSTVFVLELTSYDHRTAVREPAYWSSNVTLNDAFRIIGFVGLKEHAAVRPPEHLPPQIEAIFREGATCLAVDCYNAASTMFRLCLDLATKDLLPEEAEGDAEGPQPNRRQRRDLGLRIPWLIEHAFLPAALADLATVVREDGNDGAHAGTLGKQDAEDLLDFTEVLLERLFTEPARVALAEARRIERREAREGEQR